MVHAHRLQRRGRAYYYRRRVPGTLRAILPSWEIVRSLRTRSVAEARARARRLDNQVHALFTMLERPGVKPEDAERLIAELVDDWFERAVEEDRRERRGEHDRWQTATDIDLQANDHSEALDEGRLAPFHREIATEVLHAAGVEESLDDEQREALAWEIARLVDTVPGFALHDLRKRRLSLGIDDACSGLSGKVFELARLVPFARGGVGTSEGLKCGRPVEGCLSIAIRLADFVTSPRMVKGGRPAPKCRVHAGDKVFSTLKIQRLTGLGPMHIGCMCQLKQAEIVGLGTSPYFQKVPGFVVVLGPEAAVLGDGIGLGHHGRPPTLSCVAQAADGCSSAQVLRQIVPRIRPGIAHGALSAARHPPAAHLTQHRDARSQRRQVEDLVRRRPSHSTRMNGAGAWPQRVECLGTAPSSCADARQVSPPGDQPTPPQRQPGPMSIVARWQPAEHGPRV